MKTVHALITMTLLNKITKLYVMHLIFAIKIGSLCSVIYMHYLFQAFLWFFYNHLNKMNDWIYIIRINNLCQLRLGHVK